ncbi:MAG: helix-turn-helix domain-containing protein [Anaerolineae bacterium]|nr:helix-turn-helix domain-containing protein [Anaerolineae bacterium]
MTRLGRKPLGPALVQHLDGSPRAKERLEVILETLAGQLTIAQACARLGINEAMFHRLRSEVLAAGLAQLEPKPLGRPPRIPTAEQQQCEALQRRVAELETELKIATTREEIALVLAPRSEPASPLKKTTNIQSRKHRRRSPRPR